MLTGRTLQLDAEEETSREPSIWRDVYKLLRCPGPPCNLGPYYWPDPIGKRHYKLKTHHFKSLIRQVEQGYKLETPDDVPEEIRQQLYTEEQQRIERHQRAPNISPSNPPPIHVTNMLPTSSTQASNHVSSTSTPAHEILPKSTMIIPLDIPGYLDTQAEEYCTWQ